MPGLNLPFNFLDLFIGFVEMIQQSLRQQAK